LALVVAQGFLAHQLAHPELKPSQAAAFDAQQAEKDSEEECSA